MRLQYLVTWSHGQRLKANTTAAATRQFPHKRVDRGGARPAGDEPPPNPGSLNAVSCGVLVGGAHSSISAYVSAIGKRVRFHVPSDTDFKVRLKLPMPEGTSDEEVKTLELTHLARIKPEQDRDRGRTGAKTNRAQQLAAKLIEGLRGPRAPVKGDARVRA